jgi:hypothetical protein
VSFDYDPAREKVTCQIAQNTLEIRISPPTAPPPPVNNGAGNGGQQAPQAQPIALTKEEKKEGKKEALDLSVPESPGFAVLGLTPQTVLRPATPREFVTSLLNGLDENGNFQSGVAIDVSPYLLLFGDQLSLGTSKSGTSEGLAGSKKGDYRARTSSGFITRLLARTQFSFASVKGTTADDKSAKIGAGLHVTVFDRGDPRMDEEIDACFSSFTRKIRAEADQQIPNPEVDEETLDRYEALIQTLAQRERANYIKDCVDVSRKRNFARSSLIIGGAGSWISKDGASSKFTNNGQGIWTSLAYGFEGITGLEKKAQLIFHFRRRVKETVPDPQIAGMFTTKDSNLFGARFRFGSPNLTGNFEGVYQGQHFAGKKADSNFKLSLGTDYKVADNLYLNFSVGGETKKSNVSDGKVFVKTAFSWGFSQKALLNEDQ